MKTPSILLLGMALLASPLVRGASDAKPHAVFVIGTPHYNPSDSMGPLALQLAKDFGFKTTVIDPDYNPEKNEKGLPGLEVLGKADVAIFYTRFLTLPAGQLKHITDYLESGKPVVGIRTTTHAFQYPQGHALEKWNDGFGRDAMGSKYFIHGQGGTVVEKAQDHEILTGVDLKEPRQTPGTLYLSELPKDATVLLRGTGAFKRTGEITNSFGTHQIEAEMTDDVAWTWTNGWGGKVFGTTIGHPGAFADENWVRFLINGIHWAASKPVPAANTPVRTIEAGMEKKTAAKPEPEKADRKNSRQASNVEGAQHTRTKNQRDAKNTKSGKAPPEEDPELAEFGIYADSAANAERTEPVVTTLPLELPKGARIAFVGNTLLDRAQEFGHIESLMQLAHPDHELVFRNFAWSADEVDLQPRPDNFATVPQHLTREKIDVIVAAFGYNESFGGKERLDEFRGRLTTWLVDMKTSAFNGKTGPQIVLLSPIANENAPGVPAAELNNERIALYTKAMAEVAAEQQVAFIDLYTPSLAAMQDPATQLTINGAHLTEEGYAVVADSLFRAAFGESPPVMNEELRAVVVDKNRQYFRRYRPLNTFYYVGGRSKTYGYLDFLPAMRSFEVMSSNRDERTWAIARGQSFNGQPIDDSNAPPMDEVLEARGANEWLSPADELAAFNVDPRFEVNLFASEEQFPDIACPIAMRWDSKGRLWVSCSTTYPHIYPGQEPSDKIVILEDVDNDGKADACKVWADDVHIPLSFELIENGVMVSEEPHFSRLLDTDGDDKADERTLTLTGFGTEDSHHALHDFVWTPYGDLMFRESIFHNTQVETAYGPVRAKNSAWFQFHPPSQRLTSFGAYPNTNPWGVTYDDWGNHVASHPIFATAFQATNPPYPNQHPKTTLPAYSGVCGHEFVDFPMWPEELQGGFIKVRYKPTNRVEIHKWIEKEDGFEEEYVSDLIFSENLSFIPVDLRYGPRGAMYVCDWYNPVKGHAQYSLRDPRRDRVSGRIWRIVPKGADLQDPPTIDGAPVTDLLDNLKRREYRYRYWTKRELRKRDPETVATALDRWVADLDVDDPRFRHHQTEALWTYKSVGAVRPDLLDELLNCDNHHARAAATQQLRYSLQNIDQLAKRAQDENGIVRVQAANAASYIGTREALEAILPMLEQPMGEHLSYAVTCTLGSAALRRHWQSEDALRTQVETFLKANTKEESFKIVAGGTNNAREAQFDGQANLAEITISCVPERMMYTKTRFKVKAGQPIKLTFTNPDATPHNLAIVKPGNVEAVGMAGNEMAKDPEGIKKDFIPESDAILHHTKLIFPNQAEILRFEAPSEPGTYPYLCTFPGHWVVMKGEMIVN